MDGPRHWRIETLRRRGDLFAPTLGEETVGSRGQRQGANSSGGENSGEDRLAEEPVETLSAAGPDPGRGESPGADLDW